MAAARKPIAFEDDPDFYGKDASKSTSGKDTVFRVTRDRKGNVTRLAPIPPEELEPVRRRRKKIR